MYKRDTIKNIDIWLDKPEIILLFGARQVGKSTLLEIMASKNKSLKVLNCENPVIADILESKDLLRITSLFDNAKIIAFDEAQSIVEIGKVLKLLYDSKPAIKIIATGSSSFELANRTGEPLTGRNIKFRLLPLSINEISENKGWLPFLELRNDLLVFGSYPGIIDLSQQEKKKKLLNLSGDYLFKDIYKFERLKNPGILKNLLKAIALQVGNLVSVPELASLTGVSAITVDRYLDLLEKSFIIFKIGSYSSNLRNELKKSRKYYFYDNGIRNAVINNFVAINQRTDTGALWENYCVSEIVKYFNNADIFPNFYFWRTYDGAEIDLVIEDEGKLTCYEFKWNPGKKVSIPKSFSNKYNIQNLNVIHRDNLHLIKDLG